MDVACTVVVVNIYKEREGGYTMQEIEVMLHPSY